jgi:serine/threonine protein phosphatase PrpC
MDRGPSWRRASPPSGESVKIMERLKAAYRNYRWVKLLACIGLLIGGFLLYTFAGGFPPWAWRFAATVFPQAPHLWATQGSAVLFPLIGLGLLSLALFILWTLWLGAMIRLLFSWWQSAHDRQRFAQDLEEAEYLSEYMAQRELEEGEHMRQLAATWRPDSGLPIRASRRESVRSRPSAPPVRQVQELDDAPVPPADWFQEMEEAPSPSARWSQEMDDAMEFEVSAEAIAASQKIAAVERNASIQRRKVANGRDAVYASFDGQMDDNRGARSYPPDSAGRRSATSSLRDGRGANTSSLEDRDSNPSQRDRGTNTSSLGGRETADRPAAYRAEPSAQPVSYKTGMLSPRENKDADYGSVARPAPAQSQQPAARPWINPRSQPLSSSLPAPSTGSLRSQFHIVPRESDDYATQPYLEELEFGEPPTLPDTESLAEHEQSGHLATLRLVVGIGLDPGIVRKDSPNEDNLLAVQGLHVGESGAVPVGLFVVADGMGGHADGQEASRLAIQAISDIVSPAILRNSEPDEHFSDLLKDGAHRANLTIYRRNREQEHMMGTTLTAALIVGMQAHVVNVGDSRTYRYRPGEGLTQISRDHSVVARLVESGVISREDVYTHPKRNQIYRCLGEKASLELDYFQVDVQAGDILMLCSDGLWEMVRDPDIERIITSSSPHASQISSMLVQAALTRGGADNISVVVACVLPKE